MSQAGEPPDHPKPLPATNALGWDTASLLIGPIWSTTWNGSAASHSYKCLQTASQSDWPEFWWQLTWFGTDADSPPNEKSTNVSNTFQLNNFVRHHHSIQCKHLVTAVGLKSVLGFFRGWVCRKVKWVRYFLSWKILNYKTDITSARKKTLPRE
jgi:hypothetical protein